MKNYYLFKVLNGQQIVLQGQGASAQPQLIQVGGGEILTVLIREAAIILLVVRPLRGGKGLSRIAKLKVQELIVKKPID